MDTIQKLPEPAEVWQHHSGRHYVIVELYNTKDGGSDKFPITIGYMDVQTMERHARIWAVFREKFTRTREAFDRDAAIEMLSLQTARRIRSEYENTLIGGESARLARVQITVRDALRKVWPRIGARL